MGQAVTEHHEPAMSGKLIVFCIAVGLFIAWLWRNL